MEIPKWLLYAAGIVLLVFILLWCVRGPQSNTVTACPVCPTFDYQQCSYENCLPKCRDGTQQTVDYVTQTFDNVRDINNYQVNKVR